MDIGGFLGIRYRTFGLAAPEKSLGCPLCGLPEEKWFRHKMDLKQELISYLLMAFPIFLRQSQTALSLSLSLSLSIYARVTWNPFGVPLLS